MKGKLSPTEFMTLLDLMSRADLEQKIDAQEFVSMKPNAQSLVLKLAKSSTVAYNLKGGAKILETPTHDDKGEKKERLKRIYRGGRAPKPLQILAPKECNLNEPIDFSLDHFNKYLTQKGFKSARTYSDGMKTMLRSHGMLTMTGITILSLKTLRDAYANLNKTDQNRRVWLKKFNEYIVWEFEHQRENAK